MSKLSRDELIELVDKIMQARGTEEELDEMMTLVRKNVPHPRVNGLIFWPHYEKIPNNLTAEEIVAIALSYKPIQL